LEMYCGLIDRLANIDVRNLSTANPISRGKPSVIVLGTIEGHLPLLTKLLLKSHKVPRAKKYLKIYKSLAELTMYP